MTAPSYRTSLSRVLQQTPDHAPSPGASGYFSAPQSTLDTRLFDGAHFKPAVRQWILSTLYSFWEKHFKAPETWSTAWVAGSGVSYQWAGDRGNGDLDVLIGVDFAEFFHHNPQYQGFSGNEMGDIFNRQFKDLLWPSTATKDINGGTFEVTFYVNPQSPDIRDINPYAAYNLTTDHWDVKPPELPHDPHTLYSKEYYDAAEQEVNKATDLWWKYVSLKDQLKGMQQYSPGWNNKTTELQLVTDQAKTLFDSIHLGRKLAFQDGGSGYGDYYNFRWQIHKQRGTVSSLREIAGISGEATEQLQKDLYGQPIMTADQALTRAALWNSGVRHG